MENNTDMNFLLEIICDPEKEIKENLGIKTTTDCEDNTI